MAPSVRYERAILGRTPDDKGRRFWIAKRRKSKAASNKEVGTGNLPNRGTESATYDSLAVSHMGFHAAGQEQHATSKTSRQQKWGSELKTADKLACVKMGSETRTAQNKACATKLG